MFVDRTLKIDNKCCDAGSNEEVRATTGTFGSSVVITFLKNNIKICTHFVVIIALRVNKSDFIFRDCQPSHDHLNVSLK